MCFREWLSAYFHGLPDFRADGHTASQHPDDSGFVGTQHIRQDPGFIQDPVNCCFLGSAELVAFLSGGLHLLLITCIRLFPGHAFRPHGHSLFRQGLLPVTAVLNDQSPPAVCLLQGQIILLDHASDDLFRLRRGRTGRELFQIRTEPGDGFLCFIQAVAFFHGKVFYGLQACHALFAVCGIAFRSPADQILGVYGVPGIILSQAHLSPVLGENQGAEPAGAFLDMEETGDLRLQVGFLPFILFLQLADPDFHHGNPVICRLQLDFGLAAFAFLCH